MIKNATKTTKSIPETKNVSKTKTAERDEKDGRRTG
jgi:hypothetical protein